MVFGHSVEADGTVPIDQLYVCRRLIARHTPVGVVPGTLSPSGRPDYALLELRPYDEPGDESGDERSVHRPWLELAREGLDVGDEVAVLGHPFGLPLVVSFPAHVTGTSRPSFVELDADVSGGNSGGPVVDGAQRLRALVAGERSRSLDPDAPGCHRVRRSAADCRDCGALATRVDFFRDIVEAWPSAHVVDAVDLVGAPIDPRSGAARTLTLDSERDEAPSILIEVSLYGVPRLGTTGRVRHDGGCVSPNLPLEATGVDGYLEAAQSVESFGRCAARGPYHLEIRAPGAAPDAALLRWSVRIVDA